MLGARSVFTLCFAASLAVTPLFTTAALAAPEPADPLGPRVRTVCEKTKQVMQQGLRRSSTFRNLVGALNGGDVVVYLQIADTLPPGVDGRLTFLTNAGGVRYLLAQLTKDMDVDELIPIAGHELQHALEVARASEVQDRISLAAFYERIGIRGQMKNRYDTEAAQLAGKRVRAELG